MVPLRTGTRALLLAVAVAIAAAAAAFAVQAQGSAKAATSSVWLLGFETNSLSQWDWNWQGRDLNAQFGLDTSPSRDGGMAGRFTVRPGDVYGNSSGERSELALTNSGESQGQSYYYGWSTYFPAGWTAPVGWGDIVQWHTHFPLPAALAVNARGYDVYLDLYAGPTDIQNRVLREWRISGAEQGVWHDYVVFVRWSTTNGAIQLWTRLAGQNSYTRALSVTGIPTLQYSGTTVSSNYLKMGLYRNASSSTDTIYHDSMRRTSTLSEVLQAGPQPPTGGAWSRMAYEDSLVSGTAPAPASTTTTTATTTTAATTTAATATTSSTVAIADTATPVAAPISPAGARYATDFETNPGGAWTPNGSGSFTWDAGGGHSGSHALRITTTQPGGSLARWNTSLSTVPVTPGMASTTSAWLKTQGVTSGYATLDVTYWTASGTYIASSATTSGTNLSGTTDWTQASVSTTAPAGAASIRVELRLYGPGTAWGDDVSVTG